MEQEQIKILCEEVMGWEYNGRSHINSDLYVYKGGGKDRRHFTPDMNSADNDALIEAYCNRLGKHSVLSMMIGNGGYMSVTNYGGTRFNVDWQGEYTTAKKNEAVCEAILKAVSK